MRFENTVVAIITSPAYHDHHSPTDTSVIDPLVTLATCKPPTFVSVKIMVIVSLLPSSTNVCGSNYNMFLKDIT